MPTDSHLLDLNVLMALAWPQHVHHERAQSWFAARDGAWFTTPFTEAGFLRLSMNPVVVSQPVSMNDGLDVLAAMRAVPGHAFLPDASTLAAPAISLNAVATARQIADAHLVNLAATADTVLATLDRDIEQMLAPGDRRYVLVLP